MVSSTIITILARVDQSTMYGHKEVSAISCGILSWRSRSALRFHSPPDDRRDHAAALLHYLLAAYVPPRSQLAYTVLSRDAISIGLPPSVSALCLSCLTAGEDVLQVRDPHFAELTGLL